MSRNYSSVAQEKTLSATINNTATQITLNNLDGLPSAPYVLVLDPDTTSEEAVLVTSVSSGTTLNITRAVETGASATSHTVGCTVRHMVVGSDLQAISTHVDASTGVHGLSAGVAVAGVTQSQILTNKTINLGSNTVTGTRAQFNGSMSDDDFATINGTEILANKTLSSPTITGTITGAVVTSANIVDATIATGDLADGAVTSAKIADGTIVEGDIANSAITSVKIADSSVTSAKIADGTIVNADINAAAAIDTSKISGLDTALAAKASLTGNETLTNKHLTTPYFYQATPFTTSTSTYTIGAADLDARILRYTGTSTANHTWTMPTATQLNNYFTNAVVNDSFDFYVINNNTSGAAGTLTISAGPLTGYGSGIVFAADTGGHFRLHKTSSTTWSLYRLA